jgi:hypothetical protein
MDLIIYNSYLSRHSLQLMVEELQSRISWGVGTLDATKNVKRPLKIK